MVDQRRHRHGDRVWLLAEDGVVRTVPRGWTSLAAADPFEVIAAGRSWFRPEDLADLVAVVSALRATDRRGGFADAL